MDAAEAHYLCFFARSIFGRRIRCSYPAGVLLLAETRVFSKSALSCNVSASCRSHCLRVDLRVPPHVAPSKAPGIHDSCLVDVANDNAICGRINCDV